MDAKKLATLIAAKAKPKVSEEDKDAIFGEVADEVLAAVAKKDRGSLGKALRNLVSAAANRREE